MGGFPINGGFSAGGGAGGGGTTSPLTTKGDIWGFDVANNRIPVGADGTVLTADSTQVLGVKWAPGGGGGFPAGWFGDGSDGNVVIAANTSLTRTMYYNNLTINAGVTLTPNGYLIFVAGTFTLNGIIDETAQVAAAAVGNVGGGIGLFGNQALIFPGDIGESQSGGAGATGGTGNGPGGSGGNTGGNNSKPEPTTGGTGGRGGLSGGNTGGAGGIPSQYTGTNVIRKRRAFGMFVGWTAALGTTEQGFNIGGQGGGGGGGAGAGDGVNNGGGGGAGGGGASLIVIFANLMVFGAGAHIQAVGGQGGAGAAGTGGNAGGGGGGAGGAGGGIYVVTNTNKPAAVCNVAGGAGGAPGAGSGTGQAGLVGGVGQTGVVLWYNATAGAYQ